MVIGRGIAAILISILIGLTINAPLHAKTLLYSTLKDGVGINGLGMGNALTSHATGPNAIFYNPAGLAAPGVLYQYQDMDYQDAANSRFQAHLFYKNPFGVSRWERKTKNGDSATVTAFGYGKRVLPGVAWGITYKSIETKTNGVGLNGWSADVGVGAGIARNVRVGIVLQDAISEDKLDIPTTARAGVALSTWSRRVILSSDLVYENPKDSAEDAKMHFGARYKLADSFIGRIGYFDGNMTGGVTLRVPFGGIDYGIIASEDDAKDTIYMLGISIGRGVGR